MDYDSRRPEHQGHQFAKRPLHPSTMKREGAASNVRTFLFL
jgi:hypothetical protein